MDQLTQNIKKEIKKGWKKSKPYLQRWWWEIRKLWKKYHLTKIAILSFLMISLFSSVYLFYLAKTANVATLRAGLEQVTTIYDREEEESGTLYSQKGTFIPLEEISPDVVKALVSTEDKRFFEHKGFDVVGIGRSAVKFVLKGGRIAGGGSTITQQLAKNAYLTLDQTLVRKFKELFLAIEIEKHYSKEEILEMYLNKSYFGSGVWGVEDASKKYFSKSADALSLEEAATLVGMLKAPSRYNPIDHYDRAIQRRNVVLQLMEENKIISEDEFASAKQKELHLQDGYSSVDGYKYPYYFDAVINEAVNRYKIEEEDLLNSGYKIYTSLDQTYQQQMEKAYSNASLFQNAKDGTLLQSASIALDPKTGGVEAVIGGRGEYTFRGFNRATQMKRQPGSVMKPLGVYTPALEAGYDIDSMLVDKKLSYGADNYTPTNLSGTYSETGEVPMYQSLARSLNAPTVWLLNEIGLKRGVNKVKKFGIKVGEKDENLAAIALGGMDSGVSPMQIASAYSVFVNDGFRVEPHFITKIVDATGAVIVDNTTPKKKKVTTPEVAEKMNSMLLGVYENGTAKSNQPNGFKIAGKTGTTQTGFEGSEKGSADQWIVGYTPDITVATWMGFDQTNAEHHMTTNSSQGVGMLLKSEMEYILPHVERSGFEVADAESQVSEKNPTATKVLEQLKESVKEAGVQLRKGAGKVKEKTGELFDYLKKRIPR